MKTDKKIEEILHRHWENPTTTRKETLEDINTEVQKAVEDGVRGFVEKIETMKIEYPHKEEYTRREQIDSHVCNYEMGWCTHKVRVLGLAETYLSESKEVGE